ncbi:MAG: hypothetical protein LIO77_06185 [Rikenellaceae bacterium]|nr:hypothetical protein [Rikenellaceae bacterium]
MKKIINEKYRHLTGFIDMIPCGGFEEGGELVYNIRNQVKVFDVDGEKIVVKRFKKPHKFNRLMYTFFRGTKAERAYRNAMELKSLGVGTPVPIASINIKEKGLISDCYLITQYTDFKPVRDLILEEKYIRAMGLTALVDFTATLHEKGVEHKDFTNTNVLYSLNSDLTFDFMVIDINRMSFGYMSRLSCISNLKRLCKDSESIHDFSVKYAARRGWNPYFCLFALAFFRGVFENRKKTTGYLKQLRRSNG